MAEALSHLAQLSKLIRLYGDVAQNCHIFLNKINIYIKKAPHEQLNDLHKISKSLTEIESNCNRLINSFKDLQENIATTNPTNLQYVIDFAEIQLNNWNTLLERFHTNLGITTVIYH